MENKIDTEKTKKTPDYLTDPDEWYLGDDVDNDDVLWQTIIRYQDE
jgi:hypothetical protein